MKKNCNILSKLFDYIVRPIANNLVFFLVVFILLYSPVACFWICCYQPWLRLYGILAVPVVLFSTYLCVLIVEYLGCKKLVKLVIYSFTYLFAIIEIFLVLTYGSRFNLSILQLILETNLNEVYGFISSYVFNFKNMIFYTIIVLFIIVNYLLEKRELKLQNISFRLKCLISIVILLLCGLNLFRDIRWCKELLFEENANNILTKKESFIYGTDYTTLTNLILAFKIQTLLINEIDDLANSLKEEYEVICEIDSINVILIIGESYNKYHSQLYGYNKQTNPLLSEEKKKGNLYVFNDVVSPFTATSKCMRSIFSFYSQDKDVRWCDTPLFPNIFKRVGYNVMLVSNQECLGSNRNVWDSLNTFLVNKDLVSKLFNFVNAEKFQYDGELIKEYKNQIKNIDESKSKLIIFHLTGQHVAYEFDYPESETQFTIDDYNSRTDLNVSQKEILAHYDNATCYNDKVVASIIDLFKDSNSIVVYISDHGEEVFDYREVFGRTREGYLTSEIVKYQYEVPFMIWVSDEYKNKNIDKYKKISEAINKPYTIDDIPHLMLDLGGIKCEWFEPERSVINRSFNENRIRLLGDKKYNYSDFN